ncbi:hypothetical protein LRB_569 [Ligilactobacillus ruminis]|uniref:Uncharacterized protein n=1 Tax=Ligilactobacillus ruminis TaxID=1623 RepID=A0A837ISL6_9LACO|nr:hypothetical protein LRB_569 [Ligilactobacillus ruminis]
MYYKIAVLSIILLKNTVRWLISCHLMFSYGKNADFWNLPVKPSFRLRAKRRFLESARKKAALGYGQNVDFWNLPVKSSSPLRAKSRFLGFARKTQLPVTGKTTIFGIFP